MNVSILVNSFTGGEISPLLAARVEAPNYAAGAKRMENCIPMITGGVRKRPGSWFMRETNHNQPAVLIDWLLSDGMTVLVELTVIPGSGVCFRIFNEDNALIDSLIYSGWSDAASLEKIRHAVGKGVVPGKTRRDFILFTSEEFPEMFLLQPGANNFEASTFALGNKNLPLIGGGNWSACVYGGGRFVALDYTGGKAAYSTDGVNWKEAPFPFESESLLFLYEGGKFVAVDPNSDKAAYSVDGIVWLAATLPVPAVWRSLTYVGGKFIALYEYGDKASVSADGVTWTLASLPVSGTVGSVTYGGGKFVAMFYDDHGKTNSAKAAYSEDGITWKEANLPISAMWNSAIYEGGKFVTVAVGVVEKFMIDLTLGYYRTHPSNKAAYSVDGINWTAASLPSADIWKTFTYEGGKFVVLNEYGNKAAYSVDGISWKAATLPSGGYWDSLTYANGRFVALSLNDYGDKAAYSVDGIVWLAATLPVPDIWKAVTYEGGKFVSRTSSDITAISADGKTWTLVTPPGSPPGTHVYFGDDKWVALGRDYVNVSRDCVNWESEDYVPITHIKDITFYGGRLVLGGLAASTGSPTRIMLSAAPDSVTGTYRYDDFTLGGYLAGDPIVLDENDMSGAAVQWIFGGRRLLSATGRSTWSDNGAVPTPSDFDMNIIEYAGSGPLKPAASKEIVVYEGRDGRSLRALVWQYGDGQGGYADSDIGAAAGHLFESGIVDYAVMEYPYPLLWIVNKKGELISCAVNLQMGVAAFSRHTLGGDGPAEGYPFYGRVEKVEVARRKDRDRLYMIVKRLVKDEGGGLSERRFIEYLELEDLINADYAESHYVDSGERVEGDERIYIDPETEESVISGFERLRGQLVNVFADGSLRGKFLVGDDGTIKLPGPVETAHIGLPVKTLLSLNTAQLPANGTSFGKKRRLEKVILNLFKSVGGGAGTAETGGEPVITQRFGQYGYGEAVEPFTGNVELYVTGNIDTEGALFITHDEAAPFTALAVVERIAIMEA
jgi:hypothetical protein